MSNQTYNVEVANDHAEAEEFVAWLIEEGHDASVTNSGSTVDGCWTGNNAEARGILNNLWSDYCDQ